MQSEPLYLQVKERLRKDVQRRQRDGAPNRLPSLNNLQTDYQVSRPTLSKALAALTAEGLLVKENGRGSFAIARGQAIGPSEGSSGLDVSIRKTIGFIAPLAKADLPQRVFRGINDVAARRDMRVIMAGSQDNIQHEQQTASEMIGSGVSGLIIYPVVRQGKAQEADYLHHEQFTVPVVLVDTCDPSQGHAQVIFDNRRAGYDITRMLIHQGRTRIGMIAYHRDAHHPSIEARLEGYRDALEESRISYDERLILRYAPDVIYAQLEEALDQLISRQSRPDALMGCNNELAMEIIESLIRRGIGIPEDILVAGFDCSLASTRFQPFFPTTDADFQWMGETACRMLLDQFDQKPYADTAKTYILPVPLIDRPQVHGSMSRVIKPIIASRIASPVGQH